MPPGRTPIATEVVGPNPLDQAAACASAARRGRGRAPGVRRVPARRGQRARSRPRPRPRSSSGCRPRSSQGLRARPAARADAVDGEGSGDGRVPRRRDRRARRDDRDRGRRRRAERDGDDRRGRRPVRALAAPPAPRAASAAAAAESWCFLFADPDAPTTARRAWRRWRSRPTASSSPSSDLEIRGAGEVFGERQSGFTDLKLGRIPRDEEIVMQARGFAEEILDDDPDLERATRSSARRSRTCSATRSSSCSRADSTTARRRASIGAWRNGCRVIAGSAGGRRLSAPRGDAIRPTKDIG